MGQVEANGVEVVLVNNDRVTLRSGDVFLKVDADQERAGREVEAMRLAPVPTPNILWRRPPVLALAAVSGETLGRLGQPSTASPETWVAVGETIRSLHGAPLPPWPGKSIDHFANRLNDECEWLVANRVLSVDVINRSRVLAEKILRPWEPCFIHGDLHLEHVFVHEGAVAGIIDWSDASPGDPLYDIASMTLGNENRLDNLIRGYGGDVDREIVRGWWAWRCLVVVRWLSENGYGEPSELPEVALLQSLAEKSES